MPLIRAPSQLGARKRNVWVASHTTQTVKEL